MKGLVYSVLSIFLAILFITIASAEPFAEGQSINLKVYCNQINCTGAPQCNMTVIKPDTSFLLNQSITSFQTAFYNANFTLPEISGSYDYSLYCSPLNSFSDSFEVTPNGELPTVGKAIFYIGLLALLIFFLCLMFWAHLQDQSHLARFWWFSFMWIPMWAILFIGWSMARDFLTSQGAIQGILFYSWLIVGVLYPIFLLGLVLYTFYFIYKQKEVQKLITRGFSLEEAEGRVNGRGRGMNKW